MTIEKAQKDFNKLIDENDFVLAGFVSDPPRPIYQRTWKKKVQVAWHGEMEETLEIRITLSYTYPLVSIKRNGRQDGLLRDYSSPKRAMNAIREIVRCAGFEW